MDTGLRAWRIKNELRLSALLRDRIVVIDDHGSIRSPIGGNPHTKDGVVQNEGQQGRSEDGPCDDKAKTSQPRAKIWRRNGVQAA